MRGEWRTTSGGGGGLLVAGAVGLLFGAAVLPAVLAGVGQVITALAWLVFACGWLGVVVVAAGLVWGRRRPVVNPYVGAGARLVAERDAQARLAGDREPPGLPVTVNVIATSEEQVAAAIRAARS